ncbi:MAG: bacteriophage holin [Ignavibacterium sp.]|nr:MAG: bacteriophage holin [Ignavibacterium sp.]
MKLNIKSFSLTCGIIWGLAVLLSTWWMLLTNASGKTFGKLSKFYLGFSVSWGGSFVGLIWGFVDGLIIGAVFAWLYNKLLAEKA